MAVTETASTLITSWTFFTCDWILCLSSKQQKKSCCSLPSSSLGLTEANRQWAFKEGGKQENRVKFEFSRLPKCHYSLNPDVYPSCLACEENVNIGLRHVFITLNVSFTNEGMNEWVLHQVSLITVSSGKSATHHCVLWHTEASLDLFAILLALDVCWKLWTKCSLFTIDYIHGRYCCGMMPMRIMNTSAVHFI